MRRSSPAPDPAASSLAERLRSTAWRLLHSGAASGAWNMAVDEAILAGAEAERVPPTLRFYKWEPAAVSLGHFQHLDGIDLDYVHSRDWDVVRRPTGGRAVLHHLELTYSVILPPSVLQGAGVRTSYSVLVDALNAGLRTLLPGAALAAPGAAQTGCSARANRTPNCFALAGECDSLIPEGKLVGSAQVRRNGALLQHGSILLDAEPEAWKRIFGSPGRLATLRQVLGEVPSPARVADAVTTGFAELGITFQAGSLTPEEEDLAARLAPSHESALPSPRPARASCPGP